MEREKCKRRMKRHRGEQIERKRHKRIDKETAGTDIEDRWRGRDSRKRQRETDFGKETEGSRQG
jgi:hypothetical protein